MRQITEPTTTSAAARTTVATSADRVDIRPPLAGWNRPINCRWWASLAEEDGPLIAFSIRQGGRWWELDDLAREVVGALEDRPGPQTSVASGSVESKSSRLAAPCLPHARWNCQPMVSPAGVARHGVGASRAPGRVIHHAASRLRRLDGSAPAPGMARSVGGAAVRVGGYASLPTRRTGPSSSTSVSTDDLGDDSTKPIRIKADGDRTTHRPTAQSHSPSMWPTTVNVHRSNSPSHR
jgi:hypothetical protein